MSSGSGSTATMEYNWLSPNAGIKVSNICFGTMTFGTKNQGSFTLPGNTDEAHSHALLDRFVELGGNFIDTANIYTNGESEEIIGTWLKKHDRSSIVVATKARFGGNFLSASGPDLGLSRSAILNNLDKSLKRLQTDYIDLYYSHAWDAGVKLEETLRTYNDIIRSGKVRYFGISNVTGYQLQKIVDYCKFLGFDQSVVLQAEYSLLERGLELEVIPPAQAEGVALVPYGALKGGLLTGKFKRDEKDVQKSMAGSRLAWAAEKPKERNFGVTPNVENYREVDEYWKLMDLMAAIGKKYGKTQTQVALRWVLQRDPVSSVIIGAKTLQQLEDNMGASAGWKLTDEELDQLTEASNFAVSRPVYPYSMVERVNVGRYRKL